MADHDSMWSEVFHTIMGGGGRTIMAGDSLTIQNGATVTFDFVEEHEFTIAGYGSLIFGADYNQSTQQNEAAPVRVVAVGEKGTLVGITDPNDRYANAGIWTYAKDLKKGEPDIYLENINVDLENYYYGFRADGGSITLRSGGFVEMRNSKTTGLYSQNDGLIDLELDSLKIDNAKMGIRSMNNAGSKVSSDSLTILNVECGILGSDDGWVNLSNNQTNIQASQYGISLSGSADVTIKNSRLLQISAGQNSRRDDGSSVYAGGVSSVNIDLTREGEKTTSEFKGFLYSKGQTGGENTATITVNSSNIFVSASSELAFDPEPSVHHVSALYATSGGKIDLNASDLIAVATNLPEVQTDGVSYKERAVWAECGEIDLSGSELQIDTVNGKVYDVNNIGAAIVAGASYSDDSNGLGRVNATGLKAGTHIYGDLVAGVNGQLDFELKQGAVFPNKSEDIHGNALAANGGVLNLSLGNDVVWYGRADDYQDASAEHNQTYFAPEFSKEIKESGQVNIKLEGAALWKVTGQSWVTRLEGNGGTIDLVNDAEGKPESHALHVQTIAGEHTFTLNLNDADHSVSDMLYIQNVEESGKHQKILINSFEGAGEMADQDRIRFATTNMSVSDLSFGHGDAGASTTMMRDTGFYDLGFRIESVDRKSDSGDPEDETYNGVDNALSADKPGNDWVDQNYDAEEAQNWYLVRDKTQDETSQGGQAVIATARAAYWNAVEIDRLNKRLGDARHADGCTDGFWVRVRNDRIGTDAGVGDFRSRNYAYQFGYDHTKKEDDGKRLFGAALDYMDGNTTYRNVEGTGATDRFGVTAYMTWLGNDGWYYDLVGKWGVLSNSFRVTSNSGVYVDGDYDNHVLGASFEFGRKLTKENSLWFLEPQAQIQHVMVTEASYSTNQGTRVDQEKINSTITRLGFRVGRSFGEKQSGIFYAKADWLKEWHGHQGIKVTDVTTGDVAADASIDNKGDWFDVGFGVQSPITDTTYFFVDAEYVFGNDLDNTWNFNAGVRWMFH